MIHKRNLLHVRGNRGHGPVVEDLTEQVPSQLADHVPNLRLQHVVGLEVGRGTAFGSKQSVALTRAPTRFSIKEKTQLTALRCRMPCT